MIDTSPAPVDLDPDFKRIGTAVLALDADAAPDKLLDQVLLAIPTLPPA